MWRNNAGRQRRTRGFTLIEVLVAMAIFASLSLAAYQVLNQVQRSNSLSAEREARLSEVQRAIVIMDADFRQMALRRFRTNGEEPGDTMLLWRDYLLDSDSKGVLFVRLGWHNPQQQFPRGEVAKVGYRLKDDVLERVWWRYADTPVAQAPVVMPLLTQVTSWSMKFYFQGQWLDEWTSKQSLPQAVSVTLTLKDYGEVERIYLTSGGTLGDSNDS
ncbi:type II secretion system protein GspJ [Vibrio furnissii]|uniref:Type II secretion system protein J n=1 Tax=Vibrio furnissii TaxID=29494 RepID=A0A0Q2Y1Q1_VIBFU|nr:type II secretion system minor pseudopilin GspJ [Vibrio furnissii]KQH86620.1 type II secretion system protein GspJ [Vibrio furnissii]WHR50497.1 type II secretion system minor pseudopilin GspJ [Vibrio furnissii]